MSNSDYDQATAQSAAKAIQRALSVSINVNTPSTDYSMQRDTSTLDGYTERERGIWDSYRNDLCTHCGHNWHGLPNSMGCKGSYFYERQADATE